MPNSGTSMLAHLFQASGYRLGDNLKPPDSHNPGGYFEDLPSMLLLDKYINDAGHDLGAINRSDLHIYRQTDTSLVENYLHSLANRDINCVKDCRLLLFSHMLMQKIHDSTLVVIIRRLNKCIASNNKYHTKAQRFHLMQSNSDMVAQKNLLRFCFESNQSSIDQGRVFILKYEDIIALSYDNPFLNPVYQRLCLTSNAFDQVVVRK